MITKTKDKKGTQMRILNAALAEFSSKGLDGASIENIAREACITKQLIYHYYKSKDDLYRITLESVASGMQLISQRHDSSGESALNALKIIINFIIDEYVKNPSYAKFTLDSGLHNDEHLGDHSKYVENVNYYINNVLKPIIDRGIATGELREGLDPGSVYWLILYCASGCFLNTKIMSQTIGIEFSSKEGIGRWRDTATDFILHAMSKK